MQVDLGPGHIVLDGDLLRLAQKGEHSTQFSVHVYCGQTAALIKMPLGMEVGLGLPPYQVASGSMQPFGHNRRGPKIG